MAPQDLVLYFPSPQGSSRDLCCPQLQGLCSYMTSSLLPLLGTLLHIHVFGLGSDSLTWDRHYLWTHTALGSPEEVRPSVTSTVLATTAPLSGNLCHSCSSSATLPPSQGTSPPLVSLTTEDVLPCGLSGPHRIVEAEPPVWQAGWLLLRGVKAGELGCERRMHWLLSLWHLGAVVENMDWPHSLLL